MKNSVNNAISWTRQTGNTCGIVEAATKTNGLIVVSTVGVKHFVSKQFSFPIERIITLYNLENYFAGRIENRPLFFDNSAITNLCQKEVE